MFIGLKIFITILLILCAFFTFIGVYALDFSFIAIGILFAIERWSHMFEQLKAYL